uniref:hypothetical protein n=1 Tax=Verminephrobacter aporrectodeae TaxID=1110389 RepID=UPI0002376FE7
KNGFKPEAQLAEEVRRRYFSNPDAPIRTGEATGDDSQAQQNPLWTDPRGKPLIRNFSDVAVTFGEGEGSSHSQAFKGSSDGKPFSLMPLANHKTLDLQARGIYRVNVSVPLANLPEGIVSYTPFDKIDLRITRHTSVLIDPWAAASVQQTMDRFGKLVPLNSLFSPIEAALGIVIPLFELGEVSAPQFGAWNAGRTWCPRTGSRPTSPRTEPARQQTSGPCNRPFHYRARRVREPFLRGQAGPCPSASACALACCCWPWAHPPQERKPPGPRSPCPRRPRATASASNWE